MVVYLKDVDSEKELGLAVGYCYSLVKMHGRYAEELGLRDEVVEGLCIGFLYL